jgi:hypothetical protein
MEAFVRRLHESIPKPCFDRPFVCAELPTSCIAILIGENPATDMDMDWWYFWNDKTGFDFSRWDAMYRAVRRAAGKREVSPTRLRITRLREAGVRCLETNVFMNQAPAGAGKGVSNASLLGIAMETLPNIRVIIAHGKDAQNYASSCIIPAHIRLVPSKHFRLLSYADIDCIAADARAA